MMNTLVALFENTNEAKRAVQELYSSNFARDAVAMTNGASDAAAMRMLQNGTLASQDVQFYTEGVQRGNTLVVVQAADKKRQRATDILAKYDTVDIAAGSAELLQSSLGTSVRPLEEDDSVVQTPEERLDGGRQQVNQDGVPAHSIDIDDEQLTAAQHTSAHDFDALEADFRIHYMTKYAHNGSSYDQYRTVYRYGYDLGTDTRTLGDDWPTVEADARRTWEQRNPGTWGQFKAHIHYAWNKARGQR